MKKIVVYSLLLLVIGTSFGQKKKKAIVKKPVKVSYFAKADNVEAKINADNFVLSIKTATTPEEISIKKVPSTFEPINCKLQAFKAGGTTLYALTWTETSVTKTTLKTTEVTTNNALVFEINSKKQVFTNNQIVTHTTEKVFLDKTKDASETREKNTREGQEFFINADGSISLKSKNVENKWFYNPVTNSYEFKNPKK